MRTSHSTSSSRRTPSAARPRFSTRPAGRRPRGPTRPGMPPRGPTRLGLRRRGTTQAGRKLRGATPRGRPPPGRTPLGQTPPGPISAGSTKRRSLTAARLGLLRLLQGHSMSNGPGPLMACLDPDLRPRRRFNDPLELDEVTGGFVVRPPGGRALVGPAPQLTCLRLDVTADEPGALRQLELDLEITNGLPFQSFFRHVCRQPAGVLQYEPDQERALPQLFDVERPRFEQR